MDLRVLTDQFCEHSSYMLGYSKKTIARYRTVLNLFARREHVATLDQCTDEAVRSFFFRGRQDQHWSTNTFHTYHKSLAVFFRWCAQQHLLAESPLRDVPLPRIEKKLPRRLTLQESVRALEIAQGYPGWNAFQRCRNHAVIATLIHAGLRKAELFGLMLGDVSLEGRTLFIRQGKGSKDRVVPIRQDLSRILETYLLARRKSGRTCPEFFVSSNRNTGLTDSGLRNVLRDISAVLGRRINPHQLRHTCATLLLEGGCDLFALSQILGHSQLRSTSIYLAASADHLQRQLLKHPLHIEGVSGDRGDSAM